MRNVPVPEEKGQKKAGIQPGKQIAGVGLYPLLLFLKKEFCYDLIPENEKCHNAKKIPEEKYVEPAKPDIGDGKNRRQEKQPAPEDPPPAVVFLLLFRYADHLLYQLQAFPLIELFFFHGYFGLG